MTFTAERNSDLWLTGPTFPLEDVGPAPAPGRKGRRNGRCYRCGVTIRGRFTGWGWWIRHRLAACDPGAPARWRAFYGDRRALRPGEEPW